MAGSLGTLTLDLVAKIGQFVQPIKDAEEQAKESMSAIEQHAEGAADSIKGMIASGAGLLSLGALFGKYIQNTRDAEQEQAQLAAVLKSTGEAAGYSQDQLNDMANSMSQLSILSGGEINQAQTSLLAFTGIVGDQFPRALQAAIDMSARTGMSVVSAAETIGRALDVPSAGMGALSKQGFKFKEDQKALAKQLEETGHTAEAQGIIFAALEGTYRGAAAAARNTFDGALAGLNNTFDDLLTGDGSLQVATNLINNFTDALGSDAAKQGIDVLTVSAVGLATVMGGRVAGSMAAAAAATVTNTLATRSKVVADLELAKSELASTAAMVRATGAITAETAALVANARAKYQAAAAAASAASTSGLLAGVGRGLLGVVGGPVGLVATIGLTAASYLILRDNADASNVALETSAKYAGITASQFKNLSDAQKDVAKSELEDAFKTQNEQLEIQSNQFSALTRNIIFAAKQQGIYSKNSGEFIDIQRGVEQGTLSYTEVIERLNKLDFMTVEQKKQLLDAVTAYNNQYAEVTKTNEGLKVFGEQSKIAGSAAQNSATGITAQGQAAQAAAGQVAGLTEELDRLLQQSAKTQASSLAQTSLIGSGYAPGLAKALADAAIASGGNLSGKQAEGIIASYNAQQKLNSATETYNKKIQDGEKARQKIDADRQKSQQKTEDELKRRGQEYQAVLDSQRNEIEAAQDEYNKRMALVQQFAFGADYIRIHDKEKARLNESVMEYEVAQERKMDFFRDQYNDQAAIIMRHYDQERRLASASTKYTKAEKEEAIQSLFDMEQREINEIERQQAEQLLSAQQAYLTESAYMMQRYKLEREEIQKNTQYTKEYRKKLLDANAAAIMASRNAAGAAVGDAQQKYAAQVLQRNNPNAYAQWDLQNQYESDSGALFGDFRNNVDAIGQDPLLDEQQRDQLLLDAHQEYLNAKAAMDAAYNQQQQDLLNQQQAANLAAYSNIFGDLSSLARAFGGEQSNTYRALFAAQKGFALSSALVNNWKTISDAYANEPGTIWNKIAAGVVAASETGVFSAAIQAITPQGFSAGGFTGYGGVYDPAGIVHKGEIVWSQDDIKRWGGVGAVESMRNSSAAQAKNVALNKTLDQVSSSTSTGNVYINNYGNDTVSTERNSNGDLIVTIQKQIDSYVPAQLAKPNSSISRALSQNTQTQRRR